MPNIHKDNVPPRFEMKRSPGTRCILCDSRLQPSPNGIKTRSLVELGVMRRMICVICPHDKDQKEYC